MATIQEKIFQHALKGASKYFRENPTVVLHKVSRWDIERYAKDYLDMIEETDAKDHCGCTSLYACGNSEVLEEFEFRGLEIPYDNIIKEDIFTRFEKIVQVENPLKILTILDQLEKDNNL